ncbi:hypothetical protein CDL15_Pgr009471 [Punica granatum]|uniref:Uncharacterized protein n=1 Tax=Punica granatum TaxID=22663 RepID=A0A218WSH6_PUNGR|nr:hypothetical protein CDL15_Pgr009471 [Punica granatum]PKI55927.1 hypothetical protein CRG98_023659 [Punica granatum]
MTSPPKTCKEPVEEEEEKGCVRQLGIRASGDGLFLSSDLLKKLRLGQVSAGKCRGADGWRVEGKEGRKGFLVLHFAQQQKVQGCDQQFMDDLIIRNFPKLLMNLFVHVIFFLDLYTS